LREGRRDTVYLDSLGKPTAGIGHLVLPTDHLSVGDVLTEAQIDTFLLQDSAPACRAALTQALEADILDFVFLPYLASVNFQLGTGWTRKFPQTWGMIVAGAYEQAAQALDGTLWARQTPVRVQDFQEALRRLPEKVSHG
jgi:GH24 family phage-related lysozyme (muramidase)